MASSLASFGFIFAFPGGFSDILATTSVAFIELAVLSCYLHHHHHHHHHHLSTASPPSRRIMTTHTIVNLFRIIIIILQKRQCVVALALWSFGGSPFSNQHTTTQFLFSQGGVLCLPLNLQEASPVRMYDRNEYQRPSTSGWPTLEINISILAFISSFNSLLFYRLLVVVIKHL